MNRQLTQMEKEQKLQQHPFPHLDNIKLQIEAPRFFYTPPEDEYSCRSRYNIKADIINLTEEPAILLDIVATIEIPCNGNKQILETTTFRVDALTKEYNDKLEVGFMFPEDQKAKLYEALRNRSAIKYPRIRMCIYYRNLVGGCFKQTNLFYILPAHEEKINLWHVILNSFETEYYEKLKKLRERKKDDKLRDKLFDEIGDEIKSKVKEEKMVELDTLAISEAFSIELLEEEEYVKIMGEINNYARYIGKAGECKKKKR